MQRIVVNVRTGKKEVIDLTPQEIEEVNARQAESAPAPGVVTMRQARLALLSAGLLSLVDGAVKALKGPEGEAARIEWEYAGAVERQWPLVLSLGASLGLTEQQLDDLFLLAATL